MKVLMLEFYLRLYEETGATVEINDGRVVAINPPKQGCEENE